MRTAAILMLLGASAVARADTYLPPADVHVVCLELESGRVVWDVAPGPLTAPRLRVSGATLLVDEAQGGRRAALALADGKVIDAKSPADGGAQAIDAAPLAAIGGLVDKRGRRFRYSPGNDKALLLESGEVVLPLEGYVHDLNVVGDLAIFNFASEGASGAGEAYAWDLARGRLAWELDARRRIPSLGERGYTGIAADERAVYVSVDWHLFALDPATGAVRWMSALPRRPLRRYDSAWTTVARAGERLLVMVYETLFLVDGRDGRVLWSFDGGPLVNPWPTLHRGRLYLPARRGPVERASMTLGGGRAGDGEPTALAITRAGNRFELKPIERHAVPAGAPVWWSLRPPPASPRGEGALLLTMSDSDAVAIRIDLGSVLRGDGTVYVKFSQFYREATLRAGDRVVASRRW